MCVGSMNNKILCCETKKWMNRQSHSIPFTVFYMPLKLRRTERGVCVVFPAFRLNKINFRFVVFVAVSVMVFLKFLFNFYRLIWNDMRPLFDRCTQIFISHTNAHTRIAPFYNLFHENEAWTSLPVLRNNRQ